MECSGLPVLDVCTRDVCDCPFVARAFTVSLCDRTKSTSLRICVFPAPLLPTLRPDTHSRPLSRSSLVEFAKATAALSTGPPLRLPGYLAITFERSLAMNGDQQKGQRAPQPRTWKLPLAKNNAANPLAVALAQYPILEVSPTESHALCLNNVNPDDGIVPPAKSTRHDDSGVSDAAQPYRYA